MKFETSGEFFIGTKNDSARQKISALWRVVFDLYNVALAGYYHSFWPRGDACLIHRDRARSTYDKPMDVCRTARRVSRGAAMGYVVRAQPHLERVIPPSPRHTVF